MTHSLTVYPLSNIPHDKTFLEFSNRKCLPLTLWFKMVAKKVSLSLSLSLPALLKYLRQLVACNYNVPFNEFFYSIIVGIQ